MYSKTDLSHISRAILEKNEKNGISKKWIREQLGICHNAFVRKLRDHKWKKLEVEKLISLGIVKPE